MNSQSERPTEFLVSYARADLQWAEWIAWQLEAEGYPTFFQAWDIQAGANFVTAMHDAVQDAKRVVVVLSPDYLASNFANSEWKEFFARDPSGSQAIVIPVRVGPVDPPGLLGTINYVDMVGREAMAARSALLAAARGSRGKPVDEPEFPGSPAASAAANSPLPEYPGQAGADLSERATYEVRADDLGALRTFAAQVSSKLRSRGFSENDLEAFHISFRELVDNVARHVPGNPRVALSVALGPRDRHTHESVYLRVTDGGRGFDLEGTLKELEQVFLSTDREHGLLRVYRLASDLFQSSDAPHSMVVQKERTPEVSPVAFPPGSVVPFVFAYRHEAIRVGPNVHSFFQFERYLKRTPEFMDLIFDPLLRPARKHIGIEILGQGWTGVLAWEAVLDQVIKFAERSDGFDKTILLYADTGAGDQIRLRKYCKRANIRMFEDVTAIPPYLDAT